MIERRIHGPEFRRILGCGETWFRGLRKRGVIPAGRTDPGGQRPWWTESEVRETIERLKNAEVAA